MRTEFGQEITKNKKLGKIRKERQINLVESVILEKRKDFFSKLCRKKQYRILELLCLKCTYTGLDNTK